MAILPGQPPSSTYYRDSGTCRIIAKCSNVANARLALFCSHTHAKKLRHLLKPFPISASTSGKLFTLFFLLKLTLAWELNRQEFNQLEVTRAFPSARPLNV